MCTSRRLVGDKGSDVGDSLNSKIEFLLFRESFHKPNPCGEMVRCPDQASLKSVKPSFKEINR